MGYRVEYDDISRDLEGTARKTWGSWFFVASIVFGAIATLAGYSPLTGKAESQDMVAVAGILLSAAVAAALAWRVRSGKGWLAGSLLLVWWVVELMLKLSNGTLAIFWAAIHLAAMVNLVLGVRACWRMRGAKEVLDEDSLVATFE